MIPRTVTQTVWLAVYHGKSEFYSGVRSGALVWLTEQVSRYDYNGKRCTHVTLSVQGFYQDTAHLCLYDNIDQVTVIA